MDVNKVIIAILAIFGLVLVIVFISYNKGASDADSCKYDDPNKIYVKNGSNCVINFLCVQGRQAFSDECGCGCEAVPPVQSSNSQLYDFCLNNSGLVLGSIPSQCNYQKLVYFQNTDNAINIQFCTSYYDGCNTCIVNDGVIGGCTKIACYDYGTPRCLQFNDTPFNTNVINVGFVCAQGNFSIVFDNKNHLANMTDDSGTTLLPQVVSGSSAKYSNQKITFFTKGNEATVFDAKDESIIMYDNCTSQS